MSKSTNLESVAAPSASRSSGGAKAVTLDLVSRLRRHYLKPGQNPPGGTFLTEVSPNGTWGAGRRCDALFVGYGAATGRVLIGHEVKATRGDWLRELRDLDKATFWVEACQEWWIVAPPGVVHPDELPPDWGLLVPGAKTRTRMTMVVPAARFPERHPHWDAARAVMAKMDTLHRSETSLAVQAAYDAAREQLAQQLEQARAKEHTPEQTSRLSLLARLEQQLGVKVSSRTFNDHVSPEDLATAIELVSQVRRFSTDSFSGLSGHLQRLQVLMTDLTELQAALDAADAVLTGTLGVRGCPPAPKGIRSASGA